MATKTSLLNDGGMRKPNILATMGRGDRRPGYRSTVGTSLTGEDSSIP